MRNLFFLSVCIIYDFFPKIKIFPLCDLDMGPKGSGGRSRLVLVDLERGQYGTLVFWFLFTIASGPRISSPPASRVLPSNSLTNSARENIS